MSAKGGLRPRLGPTRWTSTGRIVLTAIVLGWFSLLILVPTIELTRRALAGGIGGLMPILASKDFQRAFGMTLWITLIATTLNTLFGIAFAIVVTRHRFWGRQLADGMLDLAFAVSPVVTGLMLVVAYGPKSVLGGALEALGISVIFAPPGMVLASLFVTLPFVVREMAPVLREIGVDQEEAAKTLGSGQMDGLFSRDFAFDPMGFGIWINLDGGAMFRRIRGLARGLGKHGGTDANRHALYSRSA